MRAWILSDLHGETVPIPTGADIALIAGDVCNDGWLLEIADRMPIVFVAGNHEFYGFDVPRRLEQLRDMTGVALLENDEYQQGFGEPLIAGATLWTDFNGGDPVAMDIAHRGMNDYRYIEDFTPDDALKMHHESLDYLRNSNADVIVTHHAPHSGSVHSRYKGQLLNYAFFSDVLETFDNPPRLWVHGHCHDNFSYRVGKTTVICNPHGYPGENPNFNPALVIDM